MDTVPTLGDDGDNGQWGLSGSSGKLTEIGGTHMAIDNLLRLTVRVHVGAFHREVDLAVPGDSSLAEILDEVLGLTNAPRISRPWEAGTLAGQPVDQAVSLRESGLDHGSVLVLSPAGDRHPPVVRDAAEALVETTGTVSVRGVSTLTGIAGAVAFSICLLGSPLRDQLPAAVLFALATSACLAVLIWCRRIQALAVPTVLLAAAGGTSSVLDGLRPEPPDLAWALSAAIGSAAVTLLLLGVIGVVKTRLTATLGTLLLLLGVTASCLAATGTATGAAAGVVVAAILMLLLAPTAAIQLAGLKVPPLPSAGQDLRVADRPDPDIDDRARRATRLHEGILLGISLGLLPALLTVALSGGGFPLGLCATAAGSLLLHAARHRSPVATWALFSAGITALTGMVLAAILGAGHPAQLLTAGLAAAAMLSAPLWAARIPHLEPTTVVWLERAESLAIAATLPLAAHLMGVFAAIRGLG